MNLEEQIKQVIESAIGIAAQNMDAKTLVEIAKFLHERQVAEWDGLGLPMLYPSDNKE